MYLNYTITPETVFLPTFDFKKIKERKKIKNFYGIVLVNQMPSDKDLDKILGKQIFENGDYSQINPDFYNFMNSYKPDLTQLELSGENLSKIIMPYVKLNLTYLQNCDLSRAVLYGADMSNVGCIFGCNFNKTILNWAKVNDDQAKSVGYFKNAYVENISIRKDPIKKYNKKYRF